MLAFALALTSMALFVGALVFKVYMGPFQTMFSLDGALDEGSGRGTKRDAVSVLERAAERWAPLTPKAQEAYRLRLERAGIRSSVSLWRVEVAAAVVFGAFGAAALCAFVSAGLMKTLVAISMGGFCGWLATRIYLRNRSRNRRSLLEVSLPNALELMSVLSSAGLPLERSIREVGRSRESVGAIADEFARVDREMSVVGIDCSTALRRMALRCDSQVVSASCSAIIQSRTQGSAVAKLLAHQAESARNAYFDAVKERVSKLEVWVEIPLCMCFVPAIVVIAMAPMAANLVGQLPTVFQSLS